MIKQGISTLSHTQRRALLKQRLSQGQLVVAPGVFEMVSAKMADQMGFEALYMTGYGTVASGLGLRTTFVAAAGLLGMILILAPMMARRAKR